MSIPLTESNEGILIPLLVQPGARRQVIVGEHAGRLKVAVTQVAEQGKANDAVIALLSKSWKIAKGRIVILRGHQGREKLIAIQDLSLAQASVLISPHSSSSDR